MNDRTAFHSYPLPHAEHLLSDDVERLRQSFLAIDHDVHALNQSTAALGQQIASQADSQTRALVEAVNDQNEKHGQQASQIDRLRADLAKVRLIALAAL